MLSVEINLVHENGFAWYSKDNIYVKGYLFDENDNFFEKEKMLPLFENINQIEVLKNLLLSFNGSFSIVIYTDDKLFFAVDRLRSFPLFYKESNNSIIVTDAIDKNTTTIKDNNAEYYEFILSGYTVNDSTLLDGYKQIQASEIIYFSKNGIENMQYFKHTHQNYYDINYKGYFGDLENITDKFIERLIESVGDKTIVIPLSGGYDSRYILAGLKKIGFKNVICYTYGNEESFEISIAKKVATMLGYKLHTIYYTDEKWNKLLNNNNKFLEYIEYSYNFSSLPHIQDFIALEELSSLKLIPSNSVIVPGFCGDLLGGSYIPIEVKENKTASLLQDNLIDYILKKHFNNIALSIPIILKNEIKNKIEDNINSNTIKNISEFISANESFFTEHKVSKFIVNALRPYEFFGYEWRIPLWDKELMEYWYKVPYQNRIDGKLYNDFLFDFLFDKYQIGFKKSKHMSHNKYIIFIRRLLPSKVLLFFKQLYYLLLRYKKNNDINNFDTFGNKMLKEMNLEKDYTFNNINGIFALWLLAKNKELK